MNNGPLWVFGYGSLMWNPGFEVEERAIGCLPGYARSFCMRSIHHRGTAAKPGLVLALDLQKDASCDGLAFRVASGAEQTTLEYLRERELISSAYLERNLQISLRDGRHVNAVTYVVDAEHVQYCGGLPLVEQAEIIARAVGGRGTNIDYLHSTSAHLNQLEIRDQDLDWLSQKVDEISDSRTK